MKESTPTQDWIYLCPLSFLIDGGQAVDFEVNHAGLLCRAFAIRYNDHVRAYLNRCSHVAMEMDWQINRFFDETGQWLICSTHGALYHPLTGQCHGGPCRGGLIPLSVQIIQESVFWHAVYPFQPVFS